MPVIARAGDRRPWVTHRLDAVWRRQHVLSATDHLHYATLYRVNTVLAK